MPLSNLAETLKLRPEIEGKIRVRFTNQKTKVSKKVADAVESEVN